MAYDDTKWGGFAKIIVDTSTLTAGDTVRVRSMTDANAIYDKTVVTPGTPLIWDSEIFKDYVKICRVQEINNTETEIGGVYKSVDYGQTLFINVLDKTTLQGIQGILNSHQETSLLSVGDTIDIIVGGATKTIRLLHLNAYASHEAIFGFDRATDQAFYLGSNALYTNRTALFNYFDTLYANMTEEDKALIKNKDVKFMGAGVLYTITQKIWCPTTHEIFGGVISEANAGNVQFDGYITQAGRTKLKESGQNATWQTASVTISGTYSDFVTTTGEKSYTQMDISVIPHFHLTADS